MRARASSPSPAADFPWNSARKLRSRSSRISLLGTSEQTPRHGSNEKRQYHRRVLGTGRRMTSVARVRVKAGTGKIEINGRPFEEYFVNVASSEPFCKRSITLGSVESVDVKLRFRWWNHWSSRCGPNGPSRALCGMNEEHFQPCEQMAS